MKKLNKMQKVFFVLLFVLLFVKVDYRLVSNINCCGDDYDYFIHAQTIATDFDFDYSNQLQDDQRIKYNGKIAPKGFVGSGLLASPFYFIGQMFDKFLKSYGNFNYTIISYSFSSIFYLFLGFKFLNDSLILVNQKIDSLLLFILYFGSGVAYFAFERFSMTHSYEVFISTLIIYFSIKYSYEENIFKKNLFAFLLPVIVVFGLLTRWTNYYLILQPLIIYGLVSNKTNITNLIKNKFYWIGNILSIALFALFSYKVYGLITFNPQYVYGQNRLEGFLDISQDFFISNFKNFFLIFFSQEFGLLWVSICIFLGFIITFLNIVKKDNKIIYLVIFLSYLQVIAPVLIWRTTASSYGFRYVFSLIPLSLFIIFINKNYLKNSIFVNSLFIFGIFGCLSILFFESTTGTQLSTYELTNSFGKENVPYANPNYVSGLIKALVDPSAYLSLLSRSYLGVLIIKISLTLFKKNGMLEFLENLGLPTDNIDFLNLVDLINSISFYRFLYFFLLLASLIFLLFNFSKLNSNN